MEGFVAYYITPSSQSVDPYCSRPPKHIKFIQRDSCIWILLHLWLNRCGSTFQWFRICVLTSLFHTYLLYSQTHLPQQIKFIFCRESFSIRDASFEWFHQLCLIDLPELKQTSGKKACATHEWKHFSFVRCFWHLVMSENFCFSLVLRTLFCSSAEITPSLASEILNLYCHSSNPDQNHCCRNT